MKVLLKLSIDEIWSSTNQIIDMKEDGSCAKITDETCDISTPHTYTRHTIIMSRVTVHRDPGHPLHPRPCHHQQLLHQLHQTRGTLRVRQEFSHHYNQWSCYLLSRTIWLWGNPWIFTSSTSLAVESIFAITTLENKKRGF